MASLEEERAFILLLAEEEKQFLRHQKKNLSVEMGFLKKEKNATAPQIHARSTPQHLTVSAVSAHVILEKYQNPAALQDKKQNGYWDNVNMDNANVPRFVLQATHNRQTAVAHK